MPHITSPDGVKIWYDSEGQGEPLVLIGGSSLVSNQWEFMLPLLKDHFNVILYDQRGAGRSDRPASGITVEQNGKNVEIAVIPGAEGTYCVVTHPAVVAGKIVPFFGKHAVQ